VTLALALLLQAAPWDGCAVDSTVLLRTTSGKRVTEERRTLVKLSGATAVVRVEAAGGPSRDETVSLAAAPDPGGPETKKEKVTIDGKTFDCSVRATEAFQGNKFSGSLVKSTIWVCAEAPTPGGLVREETESTQAAVVTRKKSVRLTRVKETVKVKGQAVTCWVVETSLDEQDGAQKTVEKAWFSRDVPGWTVRRESKVTVGDSATTAVVEAVEFAKK